MGWLWVLFILYWLPTVIAALRASPNAVAIFALNLLLGWTVLGWIIAFIWSLAAIQRHAMVSVNIANNHAFPVPAQPVMRNEPRSLPSVERPGVGGSNE